MMAPISWKSVFLGFVSGVITATVCLILVYLGGAIATAVQLKDFFATVLAALTVLPLLIILILLLPTVVLSVLIGLLAGSILNLRSSALSLIATVLLSLVLVEIVFALLLPMVAASENRDFVSMASNPFLVGLYGLILGALINRLFRWFNGSTTRQAKG